MDAEHLTDITFAVSAFLDNNVPSTDDKLSIISGAYFSTCHAAGMRLGDGIDKFRQYYSVWKSVISGEEESDD